jgi:hypothetical protein
MRSVSDKGCRENEDTIFAIYEIIWKNMVQPERPQMAIWCMRFAG